MMQTRTCYCGSTDFIAYKGYSHYQNFDPSRRMIVQCTNCAIVTRSPSLFNDATIHQDVPAGLRSSEHFVAGQAGQSNPVFEQRLEAAAGLPGRKVLDIGAGSGVFLQIATAKGWEAHGVELDRRNFEGLRQQGFTCFDRELEQLRLPADTYTLIHINHVLEHVGNPLTLLREACRLLAGNGQLVIEVPNEFDNFTADLKRLLGRQNNSHTAYFEHEWFYNIRNMRNLIAATPFQLSSIRTCSRTKGWSPQMLLHRIGHLLNRGDVIEVWLKKLQ